MSSRRETSAVDTQAGLLRGRPYGGTALLWRKSAFPSVSVLQCNNSRISGIKVVLNNKAFLVFCVYMPTDKRENLAVFTDCLSAIQVTIENDNIESSYILGDFNAHPGELFYNELLTGLLL